MPGFLGGGSSGGGVGGEIRFPTEFIDPVTKLRVSNPQNLIDTDFEYGLQPTKWETLELINNTPSFFSKSGDTTIDNILSITTNQGTREIIVRTSQEHLLAVGIPINVQGTKSITADGAYIINSIPDAFTFTYLCKDVQPATAAIDDLYTSIITGEFFQGSQLRISDENGIATNAAGLSELTVTTATTHGFGVKTPFYFLNLNSAIAQEFQAANTAARAFDASNSATAQVFDGSNTLSSVNIDFSNSGVSGGTVSNITSVNTINDTVTVSHTTENFVGLLLGQPLYYNVVAGSGFFQANPRGVVFLKTVGTLGTTTSTFQVSEVPDGPVIDLTGAMTGTFQISARSITFAGNNRNPATEIAINIQRETAFVFDGGNQGFTGDVGNPTATNGLCTVLGYTGDSVLVSVTANAGLDYYQNAMVRYSSTGTAATGLTNNATFFIQSITPSATPNLFTLTLKAFPDSPTIISASGGTGTQTFRSIGVSPDKDIVHVRNADFQERDMLEYTSPGANGEFQLENIEDERGYYFVSRRFDQHNFRLASQAFIPIAATGGTTTQFTTLGRTYNVHAFTATGTSQFVVTSAGSEGGLIDVLVVGGGGGGGAHAAPSGGGAGGLVYRPNIAVTPQSYPIVVGAGGTGTIYQGGIARASTQGGSSTAFGLTAVGGGAGRGWSDDSRGGDGGSGAGGNPFIGPGNGVQPSQSGFSGSLGFGNRGGNGNASGQQPHPGTGGGGAGAVGADTTRVDQAGSGGSGRFYGNIFGTGRGENGWFAGGGGGGGWGFLTAGVGAGGIGGGGAGDMPTSTNGNGTSARGAGERPLGVSGTANTGGGGGGAGRTGGQSSQGGEGGSGVVLVRYPTTPQQALVAPIATGGAITTTTVANVTYRVHSFTTAGTSAFNVSNVGTVGDFEFLIVGGGGGGGHDMGGGGGAGGFREGIFTPLSTSYNVTVGAGGAGAPFGTNGPRGFNGAPSSIVGTAVNLVALGGGGGASDHDTANHPAGGVNNGSTVASGGGGSGGNNNNSGFGYGGSRSGTGTPGQGFDGAPGGGTWFPGGGGGASQAGSNANGNPKGGDGRPSSILGNTFWFAGGGGGSGYSSRGGDGGRGGGGGGAVGSTSGGANSINAASGGGGGGSNTWAQTPGGNAAANSGGGGGGGAHNDSAGGAGGSGIVVIRYPIAIV